MDESIPPPPDIDAYPPHPPSSAPPGTPTDSLKGAVGKKAIALPTPGVDHRGVLSCLDGYMNIALEQTEEHVSGVVTNRYWDAFIHGNNSVSLSARIPEHALICPLILVLYICCRTAIITNILLYELRQNSGLIFYTRLDEGSIGRKGCAVHVIIIVLVDGWTD
ncbi:hypothetical protein EDB19DRAFT_1387198 [Suillus lakei]|nr:hypothetical protein EDB19DRAFT_1387198 [Suillus lakei]